jgi:oligosaccharide repeat unit polymerase
MEKTCRIFVAQFKLKGGDMVKISRNKIFLIFISTSFVLGSLSLFITYREVTGMTWLNRLFLCVLVAYCIFKGIKEKFIVNPYLLFTLVPISLFLYDVNVSNYFLVDLKQSTYLIAFYNMSMFLIGLNIARLLRFNFEQKSWGNFVIPNPVHDSRNAIRMLIIGMIPSMWAIFTGLNDFLAGNLSAMKQHVGTTPLGSVFGLFIYPAVMFAIRSKRKTVIISALLGLGFSLLLNFSKTTVVMMCITLLMAVYDKVTENRRWRKWVFIGLVAAIILIYASFEIYNNIRFDYNVNDYFQSLNYIGNVSNSMFLPYMYIISPWSNVQYILETTKVHTMGLWILKPLLGYLQIDSLFGNVFDLVPRFNAFNTYTYISVFYIDFGFWGSGICSMLLAIYIMYVYRLYLKHGKSPIICAVYSLNVYACSMLFFNNHYMQQSYPITILIIAWLWNKIFSKGYKRI